MQNCPLWPGLLAMWLQAPVLLCQVQASLKWRAFDPWLQA